MFEFSLRNLTDKASILLYLTYLVLMCVNKRCSRILIEVGKLMFSTNIAFNKVDSSLAVYMLQTLGHQETKRAEKQGAV